jgi:hypothetical protein
VNAGSEGELGLPLTLRVWGWLTARRVIPEKLTPDCRHDGTGRLCTGCAFTIEDGVWCAADFVP